MIRFEVVETEIDGLRVLERKPIEDARGYLERVFCANDLALVMGGRTIVQINRTLTRDRGVVRGMHFQHPPNAEMKIVSCLRGKVFDVAVDLRRGSPTFLRWHAERLSAGNFRTLVIPEGFAHGFQTLTDDCELLYLHTAAYAPESERGIHPGDPAVGITWPEPIRILSDRDAGHPGLAPDFQGVEA